LPLNLLVIILVLVVIFFPDNFLRIIFGIIVVIFYPGYTLVAALFPGKERLDGVERVALSFGLSLVTVSLIALILNYTRLGVRLEPVLYSVVTFAFITSAIAWFRRRWLPKEERFVFWS